MQGDKRVDELMLPVLNAINRHVKDRDAKTDIYNRAYEALLISMDVNAALREQVRWIPVSERLPEIVETEDGTVNSVFVKYKPEYQCDCGSIYSVSNTVYLSLHPEEFESWKYPTIPPEAE